LIHYPTSNHHQHLDFSLGNHYPFPWHHHHLITTAITTDPIVNPIAIIYHLITTLHTPFNQ